MAMTPVNKEYFKAALNMIQVTPQNYTDLKADMIISLYEVVAEAEQKLREKSSVNENYEKKDVLTF